MNLAYNHEAADAIIVAQTARPGGLAARGEVHDALEQPPWVHARAASRAAQTKEQRPLPRHGRDAMSCQEDEPCAG